MTRAFFISCVIHAVLVVFLCVSVKGTEQIQSVAQVVMPVSLVQLPKKTGALGAVGKSVNPDKGLSQKVGAGRKTKSTHEYAPEKTPSITNAIISNSPDKPTLNTVSLASVTPKNDLNDSNVPLSITGGTSGSGTEQSSSIGDGTGKAGGGSGHGFGSGGNGLIGSIDPLSIIRAAIEHEAKTSYPLKARKLKMEGKVVVKFGILKNGYPNDISVLAGSGYATLDDAAADIVRKAAPFPFLPEPVQVPIRFSLK